MSTEQVDRRLRTVRSALFAVAMTGTAVGTAVLWLSRSTAMGERAWGFRGFSLLFAVAFATVGWWIVRHRARNPVGWALLTAGALSGIQGLGAEWAVYALGTRGGSVPGGAWAAWFVDWVWVPSVTLAAIVFLLFPDGRPLNGRWRAFLRFAPWGAAVSTVLLALRAGEMQTWPADNPVGVLSYPEGLLGVALLPFAVVLFGAITALVLRARRATGVERTQLRWLLAPAVPAVLLVIASGPLSTSADPPPFVDLLEAGAIVCFVLMLFGIGVGIVRYQLFDIDLAINRTLVVGALVAFVSLVYAALVGGVGALLGERANLTLSMAATGLVAVGFHPVRLRVQHWSNRLVYGERATPYEVLSNFASRLESTVATDDLLERVTVLLADGTGATSAHVWLRVGGELRLAAATPPDDRPPIALDGDGPPELADVDHTSAVVHRGELLGALSITKPRGEPVSAADEKLIDGLAAQAGLLLRNQRLTAELLDLVDQLRASRQRLVAAQDEERRRLERDLHDGAQQQIVALKLTAATARTLLDRGDTGRAGELLDRLVADSDDAVAALRELAHGIYPPLLAAEGLGPAIRSRAAKLPIAVRVSADGERFPQDVEAAVYFCVLEALQNVTKYAEATTVDVRVVSGPNGLRFLVSDDGRGFDTSGTVHGHGLTNMSDRVDALGGRLSIHSAPGEGTRIEGSIPLIAVGSTSRP